MSGATSWSMVLPRGIGPGLRPSRIEIRFSSAAICCSMAGIAAAACWYCDRICETSVCDTMPALKRRSKMRAVSPKFAAVACAISRWRSNARSVM